MVPATCLVTSIFSLRVGEEYKRAALTADRMALTGADGLLEAGVVTKAEAAFLAGIDSNVQDQIDTRLIGTGTYGRPYFHVDRSGAFTFAGTSVEIIPFNNEVVDSDNCFNTTTYLFTPITPGYYVFVIMLQFDTPVDLDRLNVILRKNNSAVVQTIITASGTGDQSVLLTTPPIVADTDDYFSAFGADITTTKGLEVGASRTYFAGWRVA